MTLARTWLAVFVATLAAASACTGEGADAGGDGNADTAPRDGLWSYLNEGVQENTCGTEELVFDDDTNFEVINNGDGTFTIPQNGEYEAFTCTKTGASFVCPERLRGENTPVAGVDATVSWTVRVEGDLTSETAMTGEQRVDIECTGTSCDLLAASVGATVPCYYTVAFDASWQQAG